MPVSNDTNFDIVTSWLIKVAENTARIRDTIAGPGGGSGPGSATASALREDSRQESRFDKLGRRIEQALATQIGNRLAQAQALATRGFSGTVEGARFDYAMEQLSRQFAAVMMPLVQAFTYAAGQIESRMRMMGAGEQNRLLGGGIGALLGLRYGPLGALAGYAAGSIAMSGPGSSNPNDSLLGAGAGAYAGFRIAGPVGAFFGSIAGAASSSGDYGRLRHQGYNKVVAGLGSAALTLGDWWQRLIGTDDEPDSIANARRAMDRSGRALRTIVGEGEEGRRDVTPFQAQMGDAGSAYFRMQEAMIRTTAGADFEDAGPLKPIVDLFLIVIDVLLSINQAAGGSAIAPMGARG